MKGAHRDSVYSVAFSLNGKSLITVGRGGTIAVWDTDTGKLTAPPIHTNDDLLYVVAIHPEQSHLASVSEDGTMKLWFSSNGHLTNSEWTSQLVTREIYSVHELALEKAYSLAYSPCFMFFEERIQVQSVSQPTFGIPGNSYFI